MSLRCEAGALNEEQLVLIAIRKIFRATSLQSRRLSRTVGLTAPQLLLLQTVKNLGDVPISALSAELSLSQATVTSIIDRLEARGLVQRRRSESDRRVVHTSLTADGEALLEAAPTALQESFGRRFQQLDDWEKTYIISALQRVAAMMDADEIDASPVLHSEADISRSD